MNLATQAFETDIAELLRNAEATATDLALNGLETTQLRDEEPLSATVLLLPGPPREQLFLAFDEPPSRTLVNPTNLGQFLHPRAQQGSREPVGYIYQVSGVLETTSNTIYVRRAVRRAEMDEYPMQPGDFNYADVLYRITCANPRSENFDLVPGAQTDLYYGHYQPSTMAPPGCYYLYKDITGSWVVRLMSGTSSRILLHTRPDQESAAQGYGDCQWVSTQTSTVLARSGWNDGTPMMCIEP